MIKQLTGLMFALALVLPTIPANAHDVKTGQAHYIANEGVMVSNDGVKVMFDPLPLSGFGVYMDVSGETETAIMRGLPPFDGIDAVFISHAHRDHFSSSRMIDYMNAQTNVHLIAPLQALTMMQKDESWDAALLPRITAVNMAYGDEPVAIKVGDIEASAVRIPHSGWPAPRRAMIQNMVYRVTLGSGATVMHMGDADVRREHYTPFSTHWQATRTDAAYPPYWFFLYPGGTEILYKDLNVETAIGTHVPLIVPEDLKSSGADYFSESGETREIKRIHTHDITTK